MGDIADRAQNDSEFHLNVALKNAKSAFASRELEVKGACHYCGEFLENPMALFCPKDGEIESCAVDWEKEQQARKRNGIK